MKTTLSKVIVISLFIVVVAVLIAFIFDKGDEPTNTSSETVISKSIPRDFTSPSRSHERPKLDEVLVPPEGLKVKPEPPAEPKPEPSEEPKPQPEPEQPTYNVGEPIPHEALPPVMQIIDDHESTSNGPDQYHAYNPTGCSDENGTFSCGGRWQLSSQYAAIWAANAGFPGLSSHAETWDPAIQDAVAMDLFEKTGGSLWCNYTDYC